MKNILSILTVAAFATVTPAAHAQSNTIRVGHFPNVTHVQALVARGASIKFAHAHVR